MPLRFLEYIAKEYQALFFTDAVYSSTPLPLPTPEFYCLYNGAKDAPLHQTLKLSDTFIGDCDTIALELMVHVINVNYEKGADVLKKCSTLEDYSILIHKIRSRRSQHCDLTTAIQESINECQKEGRLVDFLRKYRGDIMSFLQVYLTEEERKKIDNQDGRYMEKIEIARKLKDMGLTTDQICEATNLSEEVIKKL